MLNQKIKYTSAEIDKDTLVWLFGQTWPNCHTLEDLEMAVDTFFTKEEILNLINPISNEEVN